jgi:hypothetical protein
VPRSISANALDHRLICSMIVIEKIAFIPSGAKNNVPTTGRRPQDSQVKAPDSGIPTTVPKMMQKGPPVESSC